MTLSACMIAKNEERCIARCIQSYRAAVDEVVVVDTGSTDQTVAIAQSLGARVVHFTWQDDFSAAKNRALEEVTGDWVLFLDADEYFENDGAARLKAHLKQIDADKDIDCLRLRRYELDAAGKAGEFVLPERVFRNHVGIRYKGPVHEYPQKNGRPVKDATAPPKHIYIMHDGYVGPRSPEKARRNIAILQRQLDEGDKDPALLAYMAQAHIPLRDYGQVLHYAREYLEQVQAATGDTLRAMLWCELALRLAPLPAQQAQAGRQQLAKDALQRFPGHPTAWLLAGNQSFEQGDADQAKTRYEKAVTLYKNYDFTNERYSSNLQRQAWPTVYLRLGTLYEEAQDLSKALGQYTRALDEAPDLDGAMEGYIRCSRGQKADAVAKRLLEWQAAAKNPKAALLAARAWRCDMLYLLLFDNYLQTAPPRDETFVTMQLLVGQTQAAVLDYVAGVKQHPLWQGSFAGLLQALPPAQRHTLQQCLAETLAGALMAQSAPLLQQLAPLAPAPVAAAIQLCLGQQVDSFGPGSRFLLKQVGRRLTALAAPAGVRAMWQEILDLAEQQIN